MSTENKFSLEEILEEQRRTRVDTAHTETSPVDSKEETGKEKVIEPDKTQSEKPKQQSEERNQQTEEQTDFENFSVSKSSDNVEEKEEDAPKEEKKKKGFFARLRDKKKQNDFDNMEDMYYGIQLKPIDEYTRSFDATGEVSLEQEGFKKLFDENTAELDDEVAKDFERLQKERRRRVAEAVENAGVDIDEVENELGIVAPVPVSAFAGDPYAKQHGIESEKGEADLPEFQKAMLQDAQTRTMEFKLDPEKDTMGIQQAKIMPEVSEDSVRRILETVQEEPEEEEKEPEQEEKDMPEISSTRSESEIDEEKKQENVQFMDVSSFSEEKKAEMNAAQSELPKVVDMAATQVVKIEEKDEQSEKAQKKPEETQQPVKYSVPVTNVTEYRKRDLPVHIINADVLQSALLSEARIYSEDSNTTSSAGVHRLKIRFGDEVNSGEAPEVTADLQGSDEMLDDYTGPADAKSVAHDLRTTMRELTLRMLVTGISMVILILASLICEAGYGPGNTEGGTTIAYTIVSLIFQLVAIGFCGKTLLNGLRSLFEFRANSDSAAAVASVVVLIQTVCAFFFSDALATGKIHLYAGISVGILFLNSLGKLTMVRRIHSNFRFVASRERKYAVRVFDDYNASLKLAGSSAVSQPTIAYQQKTGFLKRFLQISYEPDPAETSSQALAPVGLVCSLLLCVVALVITKDVALSITALAAASCVCVAVTNMLAVNLPVSRLSHHLRRSGAMVASYEGIKRMSAVNAVLVDSADLFPRGTVVLNGVKPFVQDGLEEAVLDAGVLMQTLGGPLCGVFEQVFSEHEGELPEVEKAHFEVGNGVVGIVDGREILIGSRSLLMAHEIEVPDQTLENSYTTGNRQILYVAADGELCAMFILTYNADKKKKREIQELEMNGVSLLVRSTDVNLTPQFMGALFGIDASNINVIGANTDQVCDALVSGEAGRVDAYVATKGRVESMMNVVSSCIDEKKNISFIVAMQNASVVIGFVLIAFLTFIAGVSQVSTFTLCIYELFWIVASIVLPKLKNKVK